MPIKQSAKKALRQSEKKRAINLRRIRAIKTLNKQIESLVKQGKKEEAKAKLPIAQKAIDKASKRGVIKRNTASRKKSYIAKLVKVSP